MDELYNAIYLAIDKLKIHNNHSNRHDDDIENGLRVILQCIDNQDIIALRSINQPQYVGSHQSVTLVPDPNSPPVIEDTDEESPFETNLLYSF